MDQGSSYYATPPGSSYLYNPPPPPSPAYSTMASLHHSLWFDSVASFDCSETEIADFLHGFGAIDRNRQNIGRRYVEVFRSKKEEYYKAIANEVLNSPWWFSSEARSSDDSKDLAETHWCLLGVDLQGEAFVEFASADDSRSAMAKDRMTIGNRYIELFPSSPEELEEAVSRGSNASPKPVARANCGYSPLAILVTQIPNLMVGDRRDDIMDFFKDFVLSEDAIHVRFLLMEANWRSFRRVCKHRRCQSSPTSEDRMTLKVGQFETFPSSIEM
ncbi:hypothetical protein HAX54_005955 [Datura stramonium]|uniref:Uncharacterized protein n=1 Tax=Datura stramonium TaxID=4076 RepID=A0ABS8RHR0_DATST|nr:hypothetical protein [Datura stramonium]